MNIQKFQDKINKIFNQLVLLPSLIHHIRTWINIPLDVVEKKYNISLFSFGMKAIYLKRPNTLKYKKIQIKMENEFKADFEVEIILP